MSVWGNTEGALLATDADTLRAYLQQNRTDSEVGRFSDDALTALLARVTARMQAHCGRRLIAPGPVEDDDPEPTTIQVRTYGTGILSLYYHGLYPICMVDEVRFTDSLETIPASTGPNVSGWYMSKADRLAGIVRLRDYVESPGWDMVEVDAIVGYDPTLPCVIAAGDVDEHLAARLDFETAALMWASEWFVSPVPSSEQITIAEQSMTVRQVPIPERVRAILAPYRRCAL
jgi:hypothetical protein